MSSNGSSKSHMAVYLAIAGNTVVMAAKFLAFLMSGSNAMFSEAIHSFADVSNQCLLALGIHRSLREADKEHPYGYLRERYVWTLISAVGVFFLGCGVTVYHGLYTLWHPKPLDDAGIALWILLFSFCVEGGTLIAAIRVVGQDARRQNLSLLSYIKKGSDPTGVAVILEDGAAVLGVFIAAIGISLSLYTKDPFWDSCATLFIGGLLGVVAIFLTFKSKGLLVGKSIPLKNRNLLLRMLKAEPTVEKVFDVKTAIVGGSDLRFKAEVEFDGHEIAYRCAQGVDLSGFRNGGKSDSELREDLAQFGDLVVSSLGDEIDRIEKKMKKKLPELKHIDIEVN